jgi:hypothetical protein
MSPQTCGGGGVANVCGSGSAAHVVDLNWMAPTMYTDGTPYPMSQLGGYRVYYGLASHMYGPPIDIGNMTMHSVGGLANATTFFFAVTDYDIQGAESGYSNEIMVTTP